MKKQIAVLLITFVLCLSLVPSASAQFTPPSPEEVAKIIVTTIFGEEFPEEWLTRTGFMQFIVFPFLAVFAVMYGILSEIRIFRTRGGRQAQLILSLIMAFAGGYAVLATMRTFLIANAWLGTAGFGVLLVVGIFLWIFGTFHRQVYEFTERELSRGFGRRRKITAIRNELRRIDIAASKPGITERELHHLEDRAKDLRTELDTLLKEEEKGEPERMA